MYGWKMARSRSGLTLLPLYLVCIGCGSTTSGVGELGRVRYALHSDFVADQLDLDDAAIVTGHAQYISTELTDKGDKKAGDDAHKIRHHVVPAGSSASMTNLDSDHDVPDFRLSALQSGSYTVESKLDGAVFDWIDLSFVEPDNIAVVAWVLAPDTSDWVDYQGLGPHSVELGSQVTFLPIPCANGDRLVGDIEVDLAVNPETSVVQGENVLGVYEQNVVTTSQPVSVFFVEEGEVEVTLSDAPNDLSVEVVFVVE